MHDLRALFARWGLYRSREGAVLGGVCAGLGRRVGLQPVPARVLFLVALLVLPGSQLVVHPVLWVLMPEEGAGAWPSGGGPAY